MDSITISINTKQNIKNKQKIGSNVLYKKHNTIVKIIDYNPVDDSYTIDFNGRIVDTLEQFLDFNKTSIEKKCNNCDILKNKNIQDTKKLEAIISYYKNIAEAKEKEHIKLLDKYTSKISSFEREYNKLLCKATLSHSKEIQELQNKIILEKEI